MWGVTVFFLLWARANIQFPPQFGEKDDATAAAECLDIVMKAGLWWRHFGEMEAVALCND